MGEGASPSVELSHHPIPHALDLCANLACKAVGCHMDLFPQPLSLRFVDPLDCTMLCCPIPDSTLIVHGDQVVDEVHIESEPALSFMISICGNIKKNLR